MEAHKISGESYRLNLSDHLRMGQFVDVEIKTARKRFHSKIVGLKEPEYIIVELPDIRKYGYLKDTITDQDDIIIRSVFEKTTGQCIAFNTRPLHKLSFPDKLLFLSFPTDLISSELRKEVRESVDIKAFITHSSSSNEMKEHKITGKITNLSPGGCHFEMPKEQMAMLKEERVTIEFVPPGQHSAIKKYALICSHHKEDDVYALGLAFEDNKAPIKK